MARNSNPSKKRVVVIGSGLAGYTFAREFRKRDLSSPLTIVTADEGAVYSKLSLSNAIYRNLADLVRQTGAEFAARHHIDIRTHTSVTGVDRAAKTLTLTGNVNLPYDLLVLALGAERLPYSLPGEDRPPS